MSAHFRVGHWIVEPQANRIVSRDRIIRLEPKVMDVLLCLTRHRGEVVSKEELMQQVWANTYVTEHSLKRCVCLLRKVLEHGKPPVQVIETIPKRGYRISAAVSSWELPAASSHVVERETAPQELLSADSR
jgi:DNA-binding winged helix-turn-helix (wHTH) protein